MISFKSISEKYWVLADQVVVSGAAFLTNLLLAKALGLSEYGKFSVIVMLQLFLLSLNMAFSSQIYQVVYPALAAPKQQKLTAGMLSLQLAGCFFIGIILLLAAILIPFSGWGIMASGSKILLMAGIATILYLLQDFIRRVFLTKAQAKYAFVIDSLTNSVQLLALALAWWFNILNQTVAWGIIGLSFIPSVATGLALLKPGKLTLSKLKFSWKLQKDKAGWLIGSALLQWGSGYFYVLAAGWWLGASALGALRLAQYIFGLLNLLLQAVESYVLPRAATLTVNLRAYWWLLIKKCLLMVVPLLVLCCFFAKNIFKTIGGVGYEKYTFIIYGLSLVYLVITIGYPTRIAIRSLALNKAYFTAYILSVSISLLAAPSLIKNWGLYGVLAGIMLSQLVLIFYWLFILQRKHAILWKSYI